jgi:hypothetical protein
MTMSTTPTDPMEFLKSLWGNSGMPLPGLVTPTLDTNELEKRITDLKAVEGWLKNNLSMLQAISQSGSSPEAQANPFANPALWPWNFMQGAGQPSAAEASDTPEKTGQAAPKSGGKGK